jgi:hypothetical protein
MYCDNFINIHSFDKFHIIPRKVTLTQTQNNCAGEGHPQFNRPTVRVRA